MKSGFTLSHVPQCASPGSVQTPLRSPFADPPGAGGIGRPGEGGQDSNLKRGCGSRGGPGRAHPQRAAPEPCVRLRCCGCGARGAVDQHGLQKMPSVGFPHHLDTNPRKGIAKSLLYHQPLKHP